MTRRPARTVWLIARRELKTRLRTKSFVISTAVAVLVLVGFVLMQSTVFDDRDKPRIGLTGQAIAIASPLTQEARLRGIEVKTTTVADLATGEVLVTDGTLDVLVSGAPAALSVVVDEDLDENLRRALNSLVQQQVLRAQLASVEELSPELDPDRVLQSVADATVAVRALRPPDPLHDQRLAIALVIIALLYMALLLYGTMVAHGVVEEKASRIVEIMLATVRPWQLLAGKVAGLGLVGLAQLAIVGAIGLGLAVATDAVTLTGAAIGTLAWGLFWFLLGYLLYACVFAAVGSLVSRQEDTQSVLLPVTMVLVLTFVLGFGLITRAPSGTPATVLSMLPPFAPILMPGRIALDAVPAWQIATALVLTAGTVVLLGWLGARVYAGAVLRTDGKVRLRAALRP